MKLLNDGLTWLNSIPEREVFLFALISCLVMVLLVLLLMARTRRQDARRMEETRRLIEETGRRMEADLAAQKERAEVEQQAYDASVQKLAETVTDMAAELQRAQQGQMDAIGGQLRAASQEEIERIQGAVQTSLDAFAAEQQQALLRLDASVDQKLEAVMEKRLNASFSTVTGKLDEITEGLRTIGEIASSAGERIGYANPGGYGDVELSSLLAQMLAPQQYAARASVRPNGENVADFVVIMPGQGDRQSVLLPVDCSLPLREYEELCAVLESGKAEEIAACRKLLESALRMYARRISERLIAPPYTTDYAVLFLPNEGLYAEALHLGGLADLIRQESRIVLAGPTSFAALLSSLQIGFRSLAIEEQTDRIQRLLESVRAGLGEYSVALSRTQNRLRQAAIEIESVQQHGKRMTDQLTDLPKLRSLRENDNGEMQIRNARADEEDDVWD